MKCLLYLNLTLHPSILILLIWCQVAVGIRLSRIFMMFLWPTTLSSSSQEIPGSYVGDGLLPVVCAWKTSKRRHPRGILIRYQNHLSWLLFTRRSSGSTQMSSNFFQPLVSLISFFPSRDLILVTPDQTDPRHAPFSCHSWTRPRDIWAPSDWCRNSCPKNLKLKSGETQSWNIRLVCLNNCISVPQVVSRDLSTELDTQCAAQLLNDRSNTGLVWTWMKDIMGIQSTARSLTRMTLHCCIYCVQPLSLRLSVSLTLTNDYDYTPARQVWRHPSGLSHFQCHRQTGKNHAQWGA